MLSPLGANKFPNATGKQLRIDFKRNGLLQYRDLRPGIWIWDASSVWGFVVLLARV
jgi:hypothetical protein